MRFLLKCLQHLVPHRNLAVIYKINDNSISIYAEQSTSDIRECFPLFSVCLCDGHVPMCLHEQVVFSHITAGLSCLKYLSW